MRGGFVLLLCLLVLVGPARAGYAVDRGTVGNWDTFTWITDADQFAFCGTQRALESGGVMFVSVGAAGLLMSVDVLNQSLPHGQVLPVTLLVDQGWQNRYDAEIRAQAGTPIVMIRFGWDTAAFNALRNGNRLALTAGQFGHDYSLAGSNNALTYIRDCAERQLNRRLLR